MAEEENKAVPVAEENSGAMDFAVALAQVLKDARANDCLARGLREVCKAIESKKAVFVVLAESCDDDKYKKCVEALCQDCNVNRINVADSKQLGQWCGLVRTDPDNNVVKVVKCSSCAVINAPDRSLPDSVLNSQAFKMVNESMKKK
mmetsp:Transcript_58521/g.96920  ORF Transcript_58521/g.96920 Transcript_58521/m.96920 type:complete len:147 (+) Transcript_58521:77-517(+)|eukprot:CAMPEP_0202705600 /NCGR_PEP_ID=MMETSP1385-20130828/18120_1 /ASSEMBLY_ACC=CAM_ASM_000861 /TAXON_ID=933848 /ORGANISM="Elphidium margaritaceum" /LENGTH=146 /DNA_ID=CAMNT_0049363869 /DNA_START=114 /DNA_END=554 /DNA_ORIENTATION=-